jgi:hypothetical protein
MSLHIVTDLDNPEQAAPPKLHKLSAIAAAAPCTYRSVRRACAEGRLTLVATGRLDALGRPTRLRVVEDDKLAGFLSAHAKRRKRHKDASS